MTSGSTLVSRAFSRVLSFAALIADGARRACYRRADLRRLSAVEMVSDRPSLQGDFQWLPAVRARGRSHDALRCRANSRVTYQVTLPEQATVVSACTLAPESWAGATGGVEFEIHVRTQGAEASARRLIIPGMSRFGHRWYTLGVSTAGTGPARIVLIARRVDGAAPDDTVALWGNPHILARRSVRDLFLALRSTLSVRGLRGLWHRALPAEGDRLYRLWVRETEPSRGTLRLQRQWSLGESRVFSLITFVSAPLEWNIRPTAASVRRQSYPHWEWIVVTPENFVRDLRTSIGIRGDDRIRVLGVPSASTRADAWNAALREAHGEFAAVLGRQDVLAPSALYEMARALEEIPDAAVLYSDEDRIAGGRGQRHQPHFKPDWSPDLLLAHNYIGRLTMLRVAAALAAGGFRRDYSGCEEWDLLLRLSRSAARIRRVPRCLYHRNDETGPEADDGAEAVVRDHCRELGLEVAVERSRGALRTVWAIRGQPEVSIVLPNRNAAAILRVCVDGLVGGTSYSRRELVIVDNGSTEPEAIDLYRSIESRGLGRIVPFDRPFNYSAACNHGAAVARGDLLLFLNNDIEVIQPDWLDELIRWVQRPEIGIVGAKLLYPDRTIQHAGVVFGLGLVGHIFARAGEGESGVFGSSDTYRNYLAVTGACQMIRTTVFRELGGYDERFRLSFSDVVLCMKAWQAGYRVLYTPFARLVHHESYTRKREDSAEDMHLLAQHLQSTGFVDDPYCHPELDPKALIPAVRPPFDPAPRQVIRDYVERVLAAVPAERRKP